MDIITPADRALIDAAIAAGRVRKIPRGVSGIDPITGRNWMEIRAAIVENNKRGQRVRQGVVPVVPATTLDGVDEQIRIMRRARMTYDAIAASLGMAKSNVWYRCRKMQLPS
jgi:hypothetical protein